MSNSVTKTRMVIISFIILILSSTNALALQSSVNTQKINFWGYQLQNIDFKQLQDASFDLYVIDYAENGSNETAWGQADIKSVKNENKIVISYLSIGEAEDYRFYWNNSWLLHLPEWLDAENLDWPGNYKVKYWMPGWQQYIYAYLDIIIAQGFNGIYLDIIDAYEFYESQGITNAASLMVEFVHNISQYTRNKTTDEFLIIPQNGEALLESSEYRSYISGIGIEDLYYHSDSEPVDPVLTQEREELLSLLVAEQKFVLIVDYVQDSDRQKEVYERSRAQGFIPYTTVVSLDTLTNPFVEDQPAPESIPGYSLFSVISGLFIVFIYIKIKRK